MTQSLVFCKSPAGDFNFIQRLCTHLAQYHFVTSSVEKLIQSLNNVLFFTNNFRYLSSWMSEAVVGERGERVACEEILS